jgi:hypothetical protein
MNFKTTASSSHACGSHVSAGDSASADEDGSGIWSTGSVTGSGSGGADGAVVIAGGAGGADGADGTAGVIALLILWAIGTPPPAPYTDVVDDTDIVLISVWASGCTTDGERTAWMGLLCMAAGFHVSFAAAAEGFEF